MLKIYFDELCLVFVQCLNLIFFIIQMNSIELEKQRVSIDEYNKKYYELKKAKDQHQSQRK